MQIITGEKHGEVGKGARPTEVVGGAFDVEHGAIRMDSSRGHTWFHRHTRRPGNDSRCPGGGGAPGPAPVRPRAAPSALASRLANGETLRLIFIREK